MRIEASKSCARAWNPLRSAYRRAVLTAGNQYLKSVGWQLGRREVQECIARRNAGRRAQRKLAKYAAQNGLQNLLHGLNAMKGTEWPALPCDESVFPKGLQTGLVCIPLAWAPGNCRAQRRRGMFCEYKGVSIWKVAAVMYQLTMGRISAGVLLSLYLMKEILNESG